MKQTPAHQHHNPDLLEILPSVARVVEVGCSSGALAKAYKLRNPACEYIGVEIDADYASVASETCDKVLIGDIQALLQDSSHEEDLRGDCWIFGDTLEHTQDPWQILRLIRTRMPKRGHLCACIPNMQHWSIQLRLNQGLIHYEESGLLDRTHLRWFSRITILQLLQSTGFQINTLKPRIFNHPNAEKALKMIGSMAQQLGGSPEQAIRDAAPLQYIIHAQSTS